MNRFVKVLGLIAVMLFVVTSCKSNTDKSDTEVVEADSNANVEQAPFFKLSVAQWSMHKMIWEGKASPFDFAKKAKEWGFEGIEYVSGLYNEELKKYESSEEGMKAIVERLKEESVAAGVQNLLIMVDGEGNLADPDEAVRTEAIENHKKWVDAAAELGCHSIRVNTFGTNDPALWEVAAADGLRRLAAYGAQKKIAILVENHGWLSSDAPLVMKVINNVNSDYLGTLPDFGNWCVKRKDGELWGECLEEYPDMYDGIERMMTKAHAVSAKSYDFDEAGNETKIDYKRMLQIIKDAGYTGYIGVEYEGGRLGEEEGIIATKELLINASKELN
ncbi:sugar phosphate isomerase/epimerase family protein [Flavobacteriaceae sp. LMIT009]